ncbi:MULTISPECIES: RICIN domain-containing protein [unclassified Streptomyces]|uniref:RICIN domain-containing protein n=1 Tax=unclassified Streptomyces TaxID=2593676 RepID=UPI002DDC2674|nr:RICIN domain-containing protein [Streptomyces sp. NBC_01795]WSA91386.1 RICIN domain-containing protein [Streptomyces sp. NBC_01795]WSS44823.1 RICIN domain-containing protein [Streptomyces sp. NBC_01187]
MSEDGEMQLSGAPPGQPAPFKVVITGDGAATIDGEPIPVLGDQPLDSAILDTLQGYAHVREATVTAAIANPSTGYAVHIEVAPDGSSRVLEEGAGSPAGGDGSSSGDGPAAAAGTAAGTGTAEAVAGPSAGDVKAAGEEKTPGAPGHLNASASEEPPKRGIPAPSIPRPSIPRPSIPRPSIPRISAGGVGGKGKGGTRGSDEEFEASSLLKKPWVVAATAVAVAALVTTPLAIAGSGGDETASGATQKTEDGPKNKKHGGPSGTVRPSSPGFPTGSPSGTPKSEPEPSKKDKKKSKSAGGSESRDSGSEDSGDEGSDESDPTKPPSGDGDRPGNKPKAAVDKATIPSGTITVLNRYTRKCLDIPGINEGRPLGQVQQGPCNTSSSDNQRWSLDLRGKGTGPDGANLYLIRNVKDNLCLDLPGRGPAPNTTPVNEAHCGSIGDNQLWWFDRRSNGTYFIRNEQSGNLCLDVADRGQDPHARLTIFGCSDKGDHQWRFRKV